MSPDQSRESIAIGLDDANSLVGLSAAEIRARLERGAVALLDPHRDVPEGWPSDILEISASGGRVAWRYQRADGKWRRFCEFPRVRAEGGNPPAESHAFLYTRRPAASPFALVRPVVILGFDALGLCRNANTVWVEGALRIADDRSLPDLDEEKLLRPLSPRPDVIAIERLERVLGLAPPNWSIEARDIGTDPHGSLGLGYGVDETGNSIGVLDADQRLRLAIRVGPDGGWVLNVLEDRGQWRALALDRKGLRVALHDRSGRERRWLDVFADPGGLFFLEERGEGRAVRLLLVHHAAPGLVGALEKDDVNVAAILTEPIPRPKVGGVPAFPRLQLKKPGEDEEAGILGLFDEENRFRLGLAAILETSSESALVIARGEGAPIVAAP